MKAEIFECGDSAFGMAVGNEISPEVNSRVWSLCRAVEQRCPQMGLELVPTYCGVTVHFNPLLIDGSRLRELLLEAAANTGEDGGLAPETAVIPVCYGGEMGPDLKELAGFCGLSEQEVIDIHSGAEYLIYMLGFTPGFPYMGGMDKRISMPRLESPRTKIPWGSVGIAGQQTGIYPDQSPGGWRLIGRTPLRLFDPGEGRTLLKAGMKLRFQPISPEEYARIAGGGAFEEAGGLD